MRKLIKPSEVAERFGVKLQTLEAWRSRGTGPKLPFVKLGKTIRYDEEDVERVIAESRRGAGAEAA